MSIYLKYKINVSAFTHNIFINISSKFFNNLIKEKGYLLDIKSFSLRDLDPLKIKDFKV